MLLQDQMLLRPDESICVPRQLTTYPNQFEELRLVAGDIKAADKLLQRQMVANRVAHHALYASSSKCHKNYKPPSLYAGVTDDRRHLKDVTGERKEAYTNQTGGRYDQQHGREREIDRHLLSAGFLGRNSSGRRSIRVCRSTCSRWQLWATTAGDNNGL